VTVRVAVLSDVHGNAFALDAVLRDVHACSPDVTVNLGDGVTGRADPARAYELQRALGAVEVLGSAEPHLTRDDALNTWLRAQLPEGALEHLTTLPLTARAVDDELLACHGSPLDPAGHLLWVWRRGPYEARSAPDLRALVAPLAARVVLCGHTHREGVTRIDDTLVVNVGAVSLQVDGDPRARWALLERREGRWWVELRRVPYDVEAAARWVRAHAPDPDEETQVLLTGA